MGLASALTKGPPADPRLRCAVGSWVALLPPDTRKAWDELEPLARGRVSGWNLSNLYREAVSDGMALAYPTFRRHVKRECHCGTD